MTQLVWNADGERFFETGVDRGVLFPQSGPGVPWNGLTSVSEKTTGGDPQPLWYDGVKYYNGAAPEEYAATLEAFTYPDEFALCDGTGNNGMGLSYDTQDRQMFGLSYRTFLGNDVDGAALGYKIHLIYNASAAPTDKPYPVNGKDGVTPLSFSWDLTTMPIQVPGIKATAHFMIDSTKTNKYLLAALEGILYGSSSADPAMPSVIDLVNMFVNWKTVNVTDNGDGTFTVAGPDNLVYFTDANSYIINSAAAQIIDSNTYELTSN